VRGRRAGAGFSPAFVRTDLFVDTKTSMLFPATPKAVDDFTLGLEVQEKA